MIAQKTINAPDWLEEKELLALLLSHATTKHEYHASRARAFAAKYGCDYETFKRRVEEANDEALTEWDDLTAWEAFDAASHEWQSRYEGFASMVYIVNALRRSPAVKQIQESDTVHESPRVTIDEVLAEIENRLKNLQLL